MTVCSVGHVHPPGKQEGASLQLEACTRHKDFRHAGWGRWAVWFGKWF